MKNHLLFRTKRLFNKALLLGIISTFLMSFGSLTAQVNFTQTLNADFNKGVLNNVIVASDNISLQFGASDVGSWLTTTVLPQTLAGHRAVSWNDKYAYIVGGHNGTNYMNTVYLATIQSGGITSWTAQNPLPVALRDPAVVIGTNTIYVMGGRDGSQVYNTIYYAALNTNGTIGPWQTSAVTLPANRWGHTATYMMGYIYVIGGSGSMTENTALNTVYYTKVNALNTLSSFTAGTNLTTARNRHSAVTYKNKLYVLGGYDNAGTKSSAVYIATPALNGSTGAWAAGTSLPVAISNHSSVVTNGVITVMAGAVGATLSNTVYYANGDAGSLVWSTSGNVMYDFTKDGSAFTGNGQAYYTGGVNLSATPIINCRYANMVLTTNYIGTGIFVSVPFYELGAERWINSLTFNKTYTPPANLQVSYRTAGNDGIWGDWTTLVTASPITVNQTKQYLQYALVMTGSTTFNSTFHDMTLTTPGTQISGNLNAMTTFTAVLSPYWATGDISFTAGTHTFEAGTTILFLPETGLTVGQANVICNGTVTDSVKFLSYTNETGQWDGIYFDPNSDNGVSSQFYYTVIANAGFGANNANLYCNSTNEPLLSRCSIRNADGNGIRLNSAHISIQNSVLRGNSENGLYLNLSNPTLVSSAMSYNGEAGVYLTASTSVPNFSSGSSTIDHNLYGLHYPSPNLTFDQPSGSPTITLNTYNGIAIDGGDISSDQHWNSIPYDYILLGTVRVGQYAGACRLTIEPGNTIKSLAGVQLQIGIASSYGGELYALGSAGNQITFTSHNGLAGGWGGIYFTDWSDNWGGHSQLDYCIIEKGNDYNYLSVNTVQPDLINNTIIRNAVLDGARYNNASGSITNCQFLTNGRYPLYFMNPEANPVHTGNIYTGNGINRITLSGGTYSFDRTYNYEVIPYYVLDDIIMAKYASTCRLTLAPSVAMEFAPGKKLQLGSTSSYGGEIYAVGTASERIFLRAYNLLNGGWEGIHFTTWNDNWGGVSTMEYVTINHGNAQDILIEGSSQPTLNYCNIQKSAGHGIVLYQSNPTITNCIFTQIAQYPIKFKDWTCNAYLRNNSYTSNGLNYIAMSGGSYDANRTVYFDNIPYHVLGDIVMALYANHARLTVQPGVTMTFDPGVKLQLGWPTSYGGDLWAEGKSDSLITFKPYNNTAGGWAGIYFNTYNDNWSGTSSMKYCVVEKGADYNMRCENSAQPTIDHSTFTQSTGNGLNLSSSSLTIMNSDFTNNTTNGIFLEGTGTNTIGNTAAFTCNFYNNGTYALYNNSTSIVNARYNYWGTGDSTMVGFKIYDKSDNSAKGKVNFSPFAQVPSLFTTNTVMSGTVKYANIAASPMKNASMVIKDFSNTTITSTTSNTSGVYAFPSFPSGNYTMTITPVSPSPPWAPCNSTDALAILNHFAQIAPLAGINLAGADVNFSHTINGTDALFVMKRYTFMIPTFPAGDYLHHTSALTVNGSNVTNTLQMLAFGDVNASFVPAKKSGNSVGLVHEGSLLVESYAEFDFPVRLKSAMQVGAISLGFYYPEQYLEITGAQLANGVGGFSWTAIDGLFRMGWCDMSPLNINDDEIVVILKMKAKDLSGLVTGIALDIFEYSEFADALATPNDLEIVSIPTINTTITGISPAKGFDGLSVYPNPVSQNSVIAFSLENPATVRISLLNVVGTQIMEIANSEFSSGNHRIGLKAASLKEGIYLLKIERTSNGQTISGMIKLVVSH
ncbi:MAG: right-handed parallel beta-helix repeat-containing protein [Bacteroidales bacterium]|nr:right-handed parallel beta-helix repeat-containing protein [Bacteroidales bacterium]